MNPIDAVFWWGVAMGACGGIALVAALLAFRAWFLRYGPSIPDFMGEHHDGKP